MSSEPVILSKLEPVMFSELCSVLERIEATTKRLEINDILTAYFVMIMREHPDDLLTIVHLCLSRVPKQVMIMINRNSWDRPMRG